MVRENLLWINSNITWYKNKITDSLRKVVRTLVVKYEYVYGWYVSGNELACDFFIILAPSPLRLFLISPYYFLWSSSQSSITNSPVNHKCLQVVQRFSISPYDHIDTNTMIFVHVICPFCLLSFLLVPNKLNQFLFFSRKSYHLYFKDDFLISRNTWLTSRRLSTLWSKCKVALKVAYWCDNQIRNNSKGEQYLYTSGAHSLEQ